MRALIITLILLFTAKSSLANFIQAYNLEEIKKLNSVQSIENESILEQESILHLDYGPHLWDKHYQTLNVRHRETMLSFMNEYLKGETHYFIKVKGQIYDLIANEDLVDLFIYLGDKYSVDSRFVLALHVSETSLVNYSTLNNPGNVGNNDHGGTKEFETLEEGFEAMFKALSDFADGRKWSYRGLRQNTLAKINYSLIKMKNRDHIFPAYYMSNSEAPRIISKLVQEMGWTEFNENTVFNLAS